MFFNTQKRLGELNEKENKNADSHEDIDHGEYFSQIGLGRKLTCSDRRNSRGRKVDRIRPGPAFDGPIERRARE